MIKIPAGMPPHQVEALLVKKESVLFQGKQYLPEEVPSVSNLIQDSVDTYALKAENEALKAQVERLQSEPAADLSLYELFLPTSDSQIKLLSLEKLKALAQIKGKSVEGEEKEPYIEALKEGE